MISSLAVFVFTFLIYIKGVSPSVYGGDSGDIILASWFGGVAHPPGYPLNTMLGWIFTHLPYNATVAYKANLMAAFLMAASISLLFLILEKLTKNFFVSLATSLILAFTPLFWLYAHVIEVFQLNLVLVAASVYFLVSWRESFLAKKQKSKLLYLAFLFLGLAAFHHHTLVLLFPAFGYLILLTDKKILKKRRKVVITLSFFLLGFLPYIFIPFAALRQTPINWDNPVNIENFIGLITRDDYGTFTAASFILGGDLKQKIIQLINLFLFLKTDFGTFGLLAISIGAIYSFLKQRQLFWFTLISFLFTGPFFLVYASFPFPNDFYAGLWERFLLLSYFFSAVFLAFGFKFLFDLCVRFLEKRVATKALRKFSYSLIVFFLLMLFPANLIVNNFYKTDLSNFHLGDWLGYDVLASAEDNSVVFLLGDTTAFNTQYVYYTNKDLQKVKIIKGGSLAKREYREQVVREYPDLKIPEDFLSGGEGDSAQYMVSLIRLNDPFFDIYTMDFSPNIEGHKWSSSGFLKKFVSDDEYNKNDIIKRNEEILANYKYNDFSADLGFEQYIIGHLKEIYATTLLDLSDELISNGFGNDAIKYLNEAVILSPDMKNPYLRLGNIYLRNKNCLVARDNFEKALSIDKKDWRLADILSNIYGDCLKDDEKAQQYQNLTKELKNLNSTDKL